MLSTPLFLFESPFSRLLGMYVPGFIINGPQDLHLIMDSIIWSMALSLLFIAALWIRFRDKARPFLVAAGFVVAQMVTMGLMGDVALLKTLLVVLGGVPSAAVWLTGFGIGAATSWAGWNAGNRPAVPVQAVAQPV
jgi:hypothetical protein